ncbi:hypothetical protein ACFV98_29980 [Streptomyces violascens]|uniref:hypothetical protein n=1 Tax=Streptomyces violascens TaxID=67381 RepID=UPI003652C383
MAQFAVVCRQVSRPRGWGTHARTLYGVAAEVPGDLPQRPTVAGTFTSHDKTRMTELGPGKWTLTMAP